MLMIGDRTRRRHDIIIDHKGRPHCIILTH
ncbi:hypothetical protein IL54_2244 [Sphingobium sp. ba1]|nr:hypothetical protein IL54_2244 [Sphingobium sp. ba1]